MKLVIACRGSLEEGLGHLYRAASFAGAASARHDTLIVARADPVLAHIFDGAGGRLVTVRDDDALADAVVASGANTAVFDMVRIADPAFRRVRDVVPVIASISPVFSHAAETDLFFTRAARADHIKGPEIFTGLDYAIINAHCRPISDAQFETAIAHTALPIMVSFGGADADNHSRLVVETLRAVQRPLLLWLMLGDAYRHSHDDLVETLKSEQRHEIIMARTNRSMWSVAANCAVGILSSGMSTIEAIYAGLPVISVIRANDPSNQVGTDYGRMCLDGGAFADGSYRRIADLVENLAENRDRLARMRERQRGLIDGKASERVLAVLESRHAR